MNLKCDFGFHDWFKFKMQRICKKCGRHEQRRFLGNAVMGNDGDWSKRYYYTGMDVPMYRLEKEINSMEKLMMVEAQ